MPDTLQDILRKWEGPSGIMNELTKVETSKQIKQILSMYAIRDMQTELNHQHQNYAE